MLDQGKKILFLVTKSNWGGAQQYAYDLALNLTKEFEPIVAAGGTGLLFEKLSAHNIKTIRISQLERAPQPLKDFTALCKIFMTIQRERPAIIHLNSPKAGGLGGLAAFLAKALILGYNPLVTYTVHGWSFREDRTLLAKIVIFLASMFMSFFHDRVILINNSDFEIAKKFIPQKKLALIPNGIEKINFKEKEEARRVIAEKIKTERPLDTRTRWIGTIAELTPNKGLGYLLDAVRAIKFGAKRTGFLTFIIGEGEDRQALEKQIKLLDLEKQVFLLGFIPEAACLLKAFDVFVLPSTKEGLPYALMQAMLAELPTVACEIGGVPDLITHKQNGFLISSKKPKLISEALQELLLNPTARRRFGIQARRTIETKFRLSDMLQKTISLYDQS